MVWTEVRIKPNWLINKKSGKETIVLLDTEE